MRSINDCRAAVRRLTNRLCGDVTVSETRIIIAPLTWSRIPANASRRKIWSPVQGTMGTRSKLAGCSSRSTVSETALKLFSPLCSRSASLFARYWARFSARLACSLAFLVWLVQRSRRSGCSTPEIVPVRWIRVASRLNMLFVGSGTIGKSRIVHFTEKINELLLCLSIGNHSRSRDQWKKLLFVACCSLFICWLARSYLLSRLSS